MRKEFDGLAIARQRIAVEAEARTGVLDLGYLSLTELPDELFRLTHLRVLNFGEIFQDETGKWDRSVGEGLPNDIERYLPLLAQLPKLVRLSLNGVILSDLSLVANLTTLQWLDCSNSQVSSLAPIDGLLDLRTLNCSHTLISDLQPLAKHTGLRSLSCSGTQVNNLRPLVNISALQSFSCSGTQILDLSPLIGMRKLKSLNCSYTQVSDLVALTGLSGLQSLFFMDTQVSDLTPLSGLRKLSILDCSGSQVSNLAPLANLHALRVIFCGRTRIDNLEPIAGLPDLRVVDCSLATLDDVPELLLGSPSLQDLWLYETRIPGVPSEVLSKYQGDSCLHSLRAHFADLAAGGVAAPDVKLMVLGNGRVGKTQICRRLRNEPYDETVESTHGVLVTSAPLRTFDGSGEIAWLNIWDFGGQEIYHGTHALFLRTNAIFLLAWAPAVENASPCETDEAGINGRNQPLAYWLNYVQHLGGADSPVLIVQTQCDRPEDEILHPPVDNDALAAFRWRKLLHHSAASDRGRGTLAEALTDAVTWLRERQGVSTVGSGRLRVQRKLEALREEDAVRPVSDRRHRTIAMEDFRQLCEEDRGISAPDQFLTYLNNAGVVFYREGLFGDRIVLDQGWALEAIYAVLDRKNSYRQLGSLQGRFTRPLLELLVWKQYSTEEQELFLSMMEQCGVCFALRRKRKPDDPQTEYVAPDLLPDRSEVEDELAARWDADAPGETLEFRYPLLHHGLMRSILSRLGGEAGLSALYWREGICLYESTLRSRALIEQEMDGGGAGWRGTIRLRTQGGEAAVLLELLGTLIAEESEKAGLRLNELRSVVAVRRATADAAVTRAAEREESAAEAPALTFGLPPAEGAEYCVSYAWGDDATPEGREREAFVDRLCEAAEARGIRVVRDKTHMRLGDSISAFTQRIGRARRVAVVLSDKYLASPYCMTELFEIWRNCRGEDRAFLDRVRVFVLPSAAIGTVEDRIEHAVAWKQRHDRIDAKIREHGAGVLGAADLQRFKLMQDFALRVGDILDLVSDRLRPREFEAFERTWLADLEEDAPPSR